MEVYGNKVYRFDVGLNPSLIILWLKKAYDIKYAGTNNRKRLLKHGGYCTLIRASIFTEFSVIKMQSLKIIKKKVKQVIMIKRQTTRMTSMLRNGLDGTKYRRLVTGIKSSW